jgi:hypothetical protein
MLKKGPLRERPQENEQTALGDRELRAELGQGEALGVASEQFQDVKDAPGGAMLRGDRWPASLTEWVRAAASAVSKSLGSRSGAATDAEP